jgi:hypothetical protein
MRHLFLTVICAVFFGVNLVPAAAASPSFSYEDIVRIIKERKVSSIEALLPLLPKSFRASFTLIHDSHSLQKADPMHPRAILFSSDGKLSCTFNGNPELEGYDSFECYQFRDATRSFDFREIEFPSKRNGLKKPAFSQPNQRARKGVSCTACHGQDPRPNWEDYSIWPGAYGRNDDNIRFKSTPPEIPDPEELKDGQNFLEFKKTVSTHPRYRHLGFSKDNIASPYRDDSKSRPELAFRPNSRFTALITPLMAQRNTRMLEKLPRSISYQYLRAVASCPATEEEKQLFPKFLNKRGELSYDKVLEDVATPVMWTPYFRSFSESRYKGGRPLSESPLAFQYAYNDTFGDFNASVVGFVMQSLIQNGDDDLRPFYKLKELYLGLKEVNRNGELTRIKTLDLGTLKQACGLLYNKFKIASKKEILNGGSTTPCAPEKNGEIVVPTVNIPLEHLSDP